MSRIRTLIVDDHQVLIDGITSILSPVDSIEVVASATSGQEALAKVRMLQPDVVLMDINMPEMNGIEACKKILASHPNTRIIALTMHEEYVFIRQMLDAGAHGYLLKHSGKDEIVHAIEQVYRHSSYYSSEVTKTLVEGMRRNVGRHQQKAKIHLTKREKEVLRLIVAGKTSPEIATDLYIGQSTAETHRTNLFRKLGVHNAAALVRVAIEKKLVDNDAAE